MGAIASCVLGESEHQTVLGIQAQLEETERTFETYMQTVTVMTNSISDREAACRRAGRVTREDAMRLKDLMLRQGEAEEAANEQAQVMHALRRAKWIIESHGKSKKTRTFIQQATSVVESSNLSTEERNALLEQLGEMAVDRKQQEEDQRENRRLFGLTSVEDRLAQLTQSINNPDAPLSSSVQSSGVGGAGGGGGEALRAATGPARRRAEEEDRAEEGSERKGGGSGGDASAAAPVLIDGLVWPSPKRGDNGEEEEEDDEEGSLPVASSAQGLFFRPRDMDDRAARLQSETRSLLGGTSVIDSSVVF